MAKNLVVALLSLLIGQSAVAEPVNCQQIYGGEWLERTTDNIVEGTAVFDDDPRIRVSKTIKGERQRIVKLSMVGPGEDQIWFCPDFWQPSRKVHRGRFYLMSVDENIFRIRYFESAS